MWEDGRAELQLGANTLGGREGGAVDVSGLAELAPSAVIVVRADAPSVIRRLANGVTIRIDGRPLEEAPLPLRHGTRIDIAHCRLTYSQPVPGRAKRVGDATELHSAFSSSAATEQEQWVLIEVRTGHAIPIPSEGLSIGRDPECDVVVSGKGVSRRHALVRPGPGGFELVDQSANGTQLNGARLTGAQLLRPGDVLLVGAEELRVHVGALPTAMRSRAPATEMMAAIGSGAHPPMAEKAAPPMRTPSTVPMATLQVSGGPLPRAEHRIERPVCAIGRTADNDVQLPHDSVSTSHATLLRKGGIWFVVDLGSANGTFLDGYRVAGERALSPGCVLTFGSVRCTFRPRALETATPRAVRRLPSRGILATLARLWKRGF